MTHESRTINFLYGMIGIALLGYIVPWIITPTTPLTLGAYDLAEWASLHPSQANSSPTLIVPLLLRLHLLIITMLIAIFASTNRTHTLIIISVIVLSIAQLPPLEFLISARDNINYQQQFILAIVSLIGGIGLTAVKTGRAMLGIAICLTIIGITSAINGIQQAQALYMMSLQENIIGVGSIMLCVSYFAIAIICLRHVVHIR